MVRHVAECTCGVYFPDQLSVTSLDVIGKSRNGLCAHGGVVARRGQRGEGQPTDGAAGTVPPKLWLYWLQSLNTAGNSP